VATQKGPRQSNVAARRSDVDPQADTSAAAWTGAGGTRTGANVSGKYAVGDVVGCGSNAARDGHCIMKRLNGSCRGGALHVRCFGALLDYFCAFGRCSSYGGISTRRLTRPSSQECCRGSAPQSPPQIAPLGERIVGRLVVTKAS